MRPTRLSALVLAVALSTTSCGPLRAEQVVDGQPPIAVDPPAPPPIHVDPPAPPIGVEEPGPGQPAFVEPDASAVDARPRPWETAEVLDGGDRIELRFTSGVSPCYVLQRIEIEETDEVVTITLHEGRSDTEEPVACIEIAERKATVVQLSAPIGTRSLVDGADG